MERIGVRELDQNTSQVLGLDRLVAAGRAVAPTNGGPVPLPPKLGDQNEDVAATLAAGRAEERW
ncbi:hypothetical protein CA850_21085 [Micromonospora echinospora]|uniref:hypothetical protein n=1 Tax=Micromonospora echinospora TaxID=1877 RepID=UPI000B5AFC7C|nr:hypothetical protein [Micromonospora echinospora]OZV77998.1 hypothetical protein CA850_21085 [Micromonospora echinospora]